MVHLSDSGRLALLEGQIEEERNNRTRLFRKAANAKRELEELAARIEYSDDLLAGYERQKQQLKNERKVA